MNSVNKLTIIWVILLFKRVFSIRKLKDAEDGLFLEYENYFKGFRIKLWFDDEQPFIEVPILQNIPFTYLNESTYIPSKFSKKVGEKTIKINTEMTFKGTEFLDTLILQNTGIEIQNFTFMVFNKDEEIPVKKEGFSLGYGYPSKEHSIIHMLKRKKLISRLEFTFYPTNSLGGKLYLGPIPEVLIYGRQVGICKIYTQSRSWGCNLRSVYLVYNNEKEFNVYDTVLVETNRIRAVFPCNFLEFLQKNYLHDFFKEKSCYYLNKGNKKKIECNDSDIIKEIGDIVFRLKEFSLRMKGNELFECYLEGVCVSQFKCLENNNKWILGSNFLKKLGLTFDYEKGSISFYDIFDQGKVIISQEKIQETQKVIKKRYKRKAVNHLLFFLFYFTNILGIFLLIVSKRCYKAFSYK